MFLGVIFGLRKHRESRREFQVLGDGELEFTGGVHPYAGREIEGQQVAQTENALVLVDAIAAAFEIVTKGTPSMALGSRIPCQ